jgi:hypothetical protein
MTTHFPAFYGRVLLTVFALIVNGYGKSANKSEPILKENMELFGYKFLTGPNVVSIYTDLAFLSNDLLLISVREAPGNTPLSTLLLFNVKEQKLAKSIELPVRKVNGAVIPIQNHRFLLLSSSGWQICSVELVCGEPWATNLPVFVSPGGDKATIGRFGEQRWVELSSSFTSLQELWQNAAVNIQITPLCQTASGTTVEHRLNRPTTPLITIPGESGWLIEKQSTVYFQMPDRQGVDLGIKGPARFVDGVKVIGIKEGKATLVTLDGKVSYQISAKLHSDVDFITSSSGLRFGIYELGYHGLSSLIDFGDENGSYNLARFRVFDVASGKQLFDLKWNPGHNLSFSIKPAISPDGHRIAVICNRELLVYEIH